MKKAVNFMRLEDTPELKRRVRFFTRFPDLSWDDSEDEFNELICMMRTMAIKYFDDKDNS